MVSPLTTEERVFLAGCIKSMMLADGSIEEQELRELDILTTKLKFTDFEERLGEFETKVADEETFWEMARGIKRPGARTIILESLRAIMLNEGIPEEPEEHLLSRLQKLWRK